MYDKEVQDIIDKLAVFDKMYEVMRFVDPVHKKVISYKNNKVSELSAQCFDFWGKNKICDNCISIRALNENKTFVKVEFTSDKVFMITAIPFEIEDRRIVSELLKDTTNSMILKNGEYENTSEIYAMIDGMNNLALKDPLTNIYNRRYINERLPVDLISTALSDQEITIIMADIDFFKKVNDTYGHLVGDEVLKIFASTISFCLKRETDWLARFGGEEFLICLPGAGIKKGVDIAEKIRREIESKEIVSGNNTIKITASFGVCSVRPTQDIKMESLIEVADKKLYLAKNNGRNRVEY